MQRRRQNRGPREAKKLEFSNFLPLIACIRADLGPDWGFYREFLEGVIDASTRGETASAWYEQIKPLVENHAGLRLAHEGICFLIHELETRTLGSRSTVDMPPPLLPLRYPNPIQSTDVTIKRESTESTTMLPVPLNPTPSSATAAQPRQSPNIETLNHDRIDAQAVNPSNRGQNPIFVAETGFDKDIGDHFPSLGTPIHTPDINTKKLKAANDGSHSSPPYHASDDDFERWLERKMSEW